jgi:hypothetical protein
MESSKTSASQIEVPVLPQHHPAESMVKSDLLSGTSLNLTIIDNRQHGF